MSKLRAAVFGGGPDAAWSEAALARGQDCELAVPAPGGSFADLLATGIDFAVVTAPRRDRVELVRLAAEQGVHVLLHAPMAADADAAARMTALADQGGIKIAALVRAQGCPLFEQVRQMLVADWLGGVVLVQSTVGSDDLLRHPPTADDPRLQAGISNHPLLQHAASHVHLATWLTGRPALSVTAQRVAGFLPLPVDGAVATAVLRGNVLCTFAASQLTQCDHFALHGTDGFVTVTQDGVALRGRREFLGPVFDYVEPGEERVVTRAELAQAMAREGAATELHDRFARWIDDRDDFPCPGEQAALDQRVLDAMARAMTSGRTETC